MEEMQLHQEDGADLDMAAKEANDIMGNQYYALGQQP